MSRGVKLIGTQEHVNLVVNKDFIELIDKMREGHHGVTRLWVLRTLLSIGMDRYLNPAEVSSGEQSLDAASLNIVTDAEKCNARMVEGRYTQTLNEIRALLDKIA